jgi:hypothetical protein
MTNGIEICVGLTFIELSREQAVSVNQSPPALSAMQSLETFLLLTALGRHPQALTSLATSIESAATSFEGRGPEVTSSLSEAIATLNGLIPRDFRFKPVESLSAFRRKRNGLTHFGCSPADDDESIRLSFGVGLPLMFAWAEVRHNIDFSVALVGELGGVVRRTIELLQSPVGRQLEAKNLVRGVRRWVNHHIRNSFLSSWEIHVLNHDEESAGFDDGSGWVFRSKLLERLRLSDPNVTVSCPICGSLEALVVEIDEGALAADTGTLVPRACRCVFCDFNVPKEAADLTLALCAEMFTDDLIKRTRSEYGLA